MAKKVVTAKKTSQRRNDKALKALGLRIKEIRKEKGLSQEKLGEKAGISRVQILRIEKGDLNSSITTIFLIAKGLKVDHREIMDFDL